MAKQIQLRRGTTTEHDTFTGAVGELTYDTDKDVLVVHDGVTAGGFPVAARANTDGTISLIKKDGTVITTIPATGLFNNTLTSTATDQALTAAQGKALNDQAFAVGQTWQNLTGSRALGTTYTNSTNKPIVAYICGYVASSSSQYGTINGNVVQSFFALSSGMKATVTLVIPVGGTYSANGAIDSWWELR